jgi:hypothetical protein
LWRWVLCPPCARVCVDRVGPVRSRRTGSSTSGAPPPPHWTSIMACLLCALLSLRALCRCCSHVARSDCVADLPHACRHAIANATEELKRAPAAALRGGMGQLPEQVRRGRVPLLASCLSSLSIRASLPTEVEGLLQRWLPCGAGGGAGGGRWGGAAARPARLHWGAGGPALQCGGRHRDHEQVLIAGTGDCNSC